jgi:hypothetical protein
MILHATTGKAHAGVSGGSLYLKPLNHDDLNKLWMLIPHSCSV